MDKTIYLVAGLPRTGSTLLMNILGQNPRHYVTPSSGILDILIQLRNNWSQNTMYKVWDNEICETVKQNVMKAMFKASFAHTDKPVCFDKNRGWPSFLELADGLLGGREKVKCLVTVRDMRDVVASFEKLFRETSKWSRIPQDDDPLKMRLAINRINVFISDGEPIGRAYNGIIDSICRGWLDRLHFIEYEKLTRDPGKTLREIYNFLGEEWYDKHDFNNVEQITHEDDEAHGFKDLHKIRKKVEPQSSQWNKVFDISVTNTEIWNNISKISKFWTSYKNKGPQGPNGIN